MRAALTQLGAIVMVPGLLALALVRHKVKDKGRDETRSPLSSLGGRHDDVQSGVWVCTHIRRPLREC